MIKLTETQEKYKEAIQWLIGSGMGVGKSHLLAICYIEQARRWPGERIYVNNHNYGIDARDGLLNIIRYIAHSEEIKLFINWEKGYIKA